MRASSLAQAQLSASPNRPADAVNLIDINFASFPPSNSAGQQCSVIGPEWGFGQRGTDASAPKSPSSVFVETKNTSDGIGGMAFSCGFSGTRRIYLAWWAKMIPGFKGLASNTNKGPGYISQDGQHIMHSLIFVGSGGPGVIPSGFGILVLWNSAGIVTPGAGNNCHLVGSSSYFGRSDECAGINWGLIGGSVANDGQYHRYEALYDLGSCTYSNLNCRDGIVRVWVDGTMVINVTNVNHHPGQFNEAAWSHTWDGQDAGQPNPAGWTTDHYTLARYGTASPPTIVDNPVGAPRAPNGVTAIVQ